MGRRQKGNIGEHWDPRKLRRIREDGWFRQHEAELIAAVRQKRGRAVTAAKSAEAKAAPGASATTSEYDEALSRATAIVARAMDLIRDVDRTNAPRPK
ncbi:MAG TPA: hypothetical protein VKG23_00605 [Thermoanaerobaculia bacterium]|nr:hypothetical protein [Thermoanaerobaculia bacterium]